MDTACPSRFWRALDNVLPEAEITALGVFGGVGQYKFTDKTNKGTP